MYELDCLTSSHDNLLMKQRFKEGFTIVQLPSCFTPTSTGKIIMAFSKFGEKNLLPCFSFTLKEKPSICCKMLIWLVGLGKIKRETACHHLLSQPECKIFLFTRRLVWVLNSTTWFMVVHVKRALVLRKEGKEYFLENIDFKIW